MLAVTDLRTLVLPLDPYRLTGDNTDLLSRAYDRLLSQCMRRFGFDQEPPRPPGEQFVPQGYERQYGLVEEEHARTLGYHPPDSVGQPKVIPTEPSQPPEWHAVAEGAVSTTSDGQQVPRDGCGGEAKRALYAGAQKIDDGFADRLGRESSLRSRQDSRVRAVFGAWSACMGRAGYKASMPLEMFDKAEWRSGEGPTPQEIAAATTDVACKKEVNLINVWVSVHVAYQMQLMELHADALAIIKEHWDIVRRNAVAALNGG